MARYKHIDTSPRFIAVDLERQLLPGTFEHELNHLIDHELDLSGFDARYRNDLNGAPAYPPGMLLKVVLFAYSQGIVSSRGIERACQMRSRLSSSRSFVFHRVWAFDGGIPPTMPAADFSTVFSVRLQTPSFDPLKHRGDLLGLDALPSLHRRRIYDRRESPWDKMRPTAADGGLRGHVPARPECITPHIRFLFIAPQLRIGLPPDPASQRNR